MQPSVGASTSGVIGDRDIIGGGVPVPFFGAPAPLPVGPALLAIESGAPIHVAAVRRLRGERYAGRLETILPPGAAATTGPGARRARVEALLAEEAAAFERLIADAPEQWWSVFFPIWPDLAPEPRP